VHDSALRHAVVCVCWSCTSKAASLSSPWQQSAEDGQALRITHFKNSPLHSVSHNVNKMLCVYRPIYKYKLRWISLTALYTVYILENLFATSVHVNMTISDGNKQFCCDIFCFRSISNRRHVKTNQTGISWMIMLGCYCPE